jgi:hypothetical protein
MLFSDVFVGLSKVIMGDEANLEQREENGLNELVRTFPPQNHNLDLPIASKGLPLGSLGNFSYVRERIASITDDELENFRKKVFNWIPAISILLGAAFPSSSVQRLPSQIKMISVSQDFGVNLDLPLVILWVLVVLEGAAPEITLKPPIVSIVEPEGPNEIEVDPS